MGKRWLPLESNPEVLNDFAAKLGMAVDKFKFCDVFGLDPVGPPSAVHLSQHRHLQGPKLHVHTAVGVESKDKSTR